MAALDDFFVALSRRMGWEPTPWRLNVLNTMAQMEGTGLQAWNPLDTTHPYGAVGNWNSVGVKIYPDMATGVEATAKTMEEPQYAVLREAMAREGAVPGVERDLQTWGWQVGSGASNAILNAMQGGGSMVTDPAQQALETAAPQAPPDTTESGWMDFLRKKGFITTWVDPQFGTSYEEPMENIPAFILEDLWAEYKGKPSPGGPTAYQQWEMGFSEREAEMLRAYKEIEAKVDSGKWTAEQAISEWVNTQTAIQNRIGEAGTRGQYVQGVLEERARRSTPAEYYPGFEPEGAVSKMLGGWGLPGITAEAPLISEMPNPWETFQQANVNVGLPGQTPSVGAYPQAENPYAGVLPMYESLAGGTNPFQQFQAQQGAVPPAGAPTQMPINLRQILEQMGLSPMPIGV